MSVAENGQRSIFDVAEGERRRDRAIENVERGAPPSWMDAARQAVNALAVWSPDGFTTDDVWMRLDAYGFHDGPPEPRALGAVMRAAERAGTITATDRYTPSKRPACHRRPVRVWIRGPKRGTKL